VLCRLVWIWIVKNNRRRELVENFYDMLDWEPGEYEIIVKGGKRIKVSGEIWESWGVHWEESEDTHRLTYIPNGRMVGIENENIYFNCEKDKLKELATRLNPYLKGGKIPSNPRPMKKAIRDFYNSL